MSGSIQSTRTRSGRRSPMLASAAWLCSASATSQPARRNPKAIRSRIGLLIFDDEYSRVCHAQAIRRDVSLLTKL